jgi:hypothetical protein
VASNEGESSRVTAPELLLLFSVKLPKTVLLCIFLCFLFGPIVLSLGPDSWTKILDLLPATWASVSQSLKGFTTELTAASKFIGGVITAYGAYVGFRRLPLRS